MRRSCFYSFSPFFTNSGTKWTWRHFYQSLEVPIFVSKVSWVLVGVLSRVLFLFLFVCLFLVFFFIWPYSNQKSAKYRKRKTEQKQICKNVQIFHETNKTKQKTLNRADWCIYYERVAFSWKIDVRNKKCLMWFFFFSCFFFVCFCFCFCFFFFSWM